MRLASELPIRRLGLGTGAEAGAPAGASGRNYVIWTFLLRSHGHGFEHSSLRIITVEAWLLSVA